MWLGVGASAIPYDLGPIDIGKARRTGQSVSPNEDRQGFPQAEFAPDVGATASGNGAAALADTPSGAVSGNGASTSMSMESQVPITKCGKSKTDYELLLKLDFVATVCYEQLLSASKSVCRCTFGSVTSCRLVSRV